MVGKQRVPSFIPRFWWSLAVVVLVVDSVVTTTTHEPDHSITVTSNHTQFFGGFDNEAYLNWFECTGRTTYQAFVYLPSDGGGGVDGAAVHWTLTNENDDSAAPSSSHIELAIVVRATGWVGFGVSENGGMTGSDLFLFEAANPDVVQDAYVAEQRTVPTLDCQQDWELINTTTTGDGFLMVQVRRALKTGDTTHDLNIFAEAGTTSPVQRVIAAWGDSETVSYHGSNHRAKGTIRWNVTHVRSSSSSAVVQMDQATTTTTETTSNTIRYADEQFIFKNKMLSASDGFFQYINTNYSTKPIETVYENYCLSANDLRAQGLPLDQGVTIIGIEGIFDTRYAHHFLVFAYVEENKGCKGTTQLVYRSTPGEPPMLFPDNVGFHVGGTNPNNFRNFRIQYHYHNIDLVEGVIDSSGVRFHYSSQPRQYDLGFLRLGDPNLQLSNQPVGDGVSRHSFLCQPDCSATALRVDLPPPWPHVTVLREMLHMHTSGIRAENLQYRNGTLIRRGAADYYDSAWGSPYVMQEPFQIQAGDSFESNCYYRNSNSDAQQQPAAPKQRIFGAGTNDEMCIVYLLYYPRITIAAEAAGQELPWICALKNSFLPCAPSYESKYNVTDDSTSIGRVFGTPNPQCDEAARTGG